MIKILTKSKEFYVILTLLLYMTLKLACDPLFFRTIEITIFGHSFMSMASSTIFSSTYALSDMIAFMKGRYIAIMVIIAATLCDGIFSYLIYFAGQMKIPNFTAHDVGDLNNTLAINHIAEQLPKLWHNGIIASLVTAIIEVIIFTTLLKKIKNFAISTICSVSIVLITHNILLDHQMLKSFDDQWEKIFTGFFLNMILVIIYALLVQAFISFYKSRTKKSN